jgi:hypothetical protein
MRTFHTLFLKLLKGSPKIWLKYLRVKAQCRLHRKFLFVSEPHIYFSWRRAGNVTGSFVRAQAILLSLMLTVRKEDDRSPSVICLSSSEMYGRGGRGGGWYSCINESLPVTASVRRHVLHRPLTTFSLVMAAAAARSPKTLAATDLL